jgi:hypothetical protein
VGKYKPATHPAVEATARKGGGNVRKHQARDGSHRFRTRSACVPHGIPAGIPSLAHSASEDMQPLLLPLRLLRQSLIDHLRDTVQNPYLLHPHTKVVVRAITKYIAL